MSYTFNPFTGNFDVVRNLTFPGTLVIASGKTATINNTLTLAGTDSTTMTFPTTSATVARTDAAQTFTLANDTTMAVAGGSVTGSGTTPFLSVTGTWNTSGAPTAFKVNVINTASSGSALLSDFQVGGSSRFSLTPLGTGTFAGNVLGAFVQGSSAVQATGSGAYMTVPSDGLYSWAGFDLRLYRDAANTLAQRNGTAAQRANLYNTFTTVATAGEWWKADWQGTANQFRMGAVAGSSSGTNRSASWDYGDKLASATAAITVPATSGNIVFGGGVQLSNAAVTGLVAGAVAALTTATIVLYDSTGQAYRVPCVI